MMVLRERLPYTSVKPLSGSSSSTVFKPSDYAVSSILTLSTNDTERSYVVGMPVYIQYVDDSSIYLRGTVWAYTYWTGVLLVNITQGNSYSSNQNS